MNEGYVRSRLAILPHILLHTFTRAKPFLG